jgi:hypothetical protein
VRTRIGWNGKPIPARKRVSPDDMAAELPEPETCGTCAHVTRCLAVGYTGSRERTSCDFIPIRFSPAAPPSAGSDPSRAPADAAPLGEREPVRGPIERLERGEP